MGYQLDHTVQKCTPSRFYVKRKQIFCICTPLVVTRTKPKNQKKLLLQDNWDPPMPNKTVLTIFDISVDLVVSAI